MNKAWWLPIIIAGLITGLAMTEKLLNKEETASNNRKAFGTGLATWLFTSALIGKIASLW